MSATNFSASQLDNVLLETTPKNFDGDILIADPAYMVRPMDYSTEPRSEDFMKKPEEYPGGRDSEEYQKDWERYYAAITAWEAQHPNEWDITSCGDHLEFVRIPHFLTISILKEANLSMFIDSIYSGFDVYCESGAVSVALLDEVLAHNPDFDMNRGIVLKRFHGAINCIYYKDGSILIVGKSEDPSKSFVLRITD